MLCRRFWQAANTGGRARANMLALVLAAAFIGGTAYAATLADLTYYQPNGWTSYIPVSTVPGSQLDSTSTPHYTTNNVLFVNLAVINQGNADATAFYVTLLVDGVAPIGSSGVYQVSGLAVGQNPWKQTDINIGKLSHGTHNIQMLINPQGTNAPANPPYSPLNVPESNVNNNGLIKTVFVDYPKPTITSGTGFSATCGVGMPPYQIEATPNITSYGAANLPTWANVDTQTGVVSGTPPMDYTAPGSSSITFSVSATNSSGTTSKDVTVTIYPFPPAINSPLQWSALIGVPMNPYTITYTGSHTSTVTALPLPMNGLTLANPVISGTPDRAGALFITLTVSNTSATDVKILEIDVGGPPVITSDLAIAGTAHLPFSFQVTAISNPSYFAISPSTMPPGLTINNSSGLISGIPTTPGSYTVPVYTTNDFGSATATMVIGIQDGPNPAIISPLSMHGWYSSTSTPIPLSPPAPLTLPPPSPTFYYAINASGLPDTTNSTIPSYWYVGEPENGAPLVRVMTLVDGAVTGTPFIQTNNPSEVSVTMVTSGSSSALAEGTVDILQGGPPARTNPSASGTTMTVFDGQPLTSTHPLNTATFEFTSTGNVASGNIPVTIVIYTDKSGNPVPDPDATLANLASAIGGSGLSVNAFGGFARWRVVPNGATPPFGATRFKYAFGGSVPPLIPEAPSLGGQPQGVRTISISDVPTIGPIRTNLTGELTGVPAGGSINIYPITVSVTYLDYNGGSPHFWSVTQNVTVYIDAETPHINTPKLGLSTQESGNDFTPLPAPYDTDIGVSPGNGGSLAVDATVPTTEQVWLYAPQPFGSSVPPWTTAGTQTNPPAARGGGPYPASPAYFNGFASPLTTANTDPAPGLYWDKICCMDGANVTYSTDIDPWPYVGVAARQYDVVVFPGTNAQHTDVAPDVPNVFALAYVGDTNVRIPVGGGGGTVDEVVMQTDGASPRNDGLTGLPNPDFGSHAAGERSLGDIGLMFDPVGQQIIGLPFVWAATQSGTFFLRVHSVIDYGPINGDPYILEGYGCITLRIEHVSTNSPIIVGPTAFVGPISTPTETGKFNFVINAVNGGGIVLPSLTVVNVGSPAKPLPAVLDPNNPNNGWFGNGVGTTPASGPITVADTDTGDSNGVAGPYVATFQWVSPTGYFANVYRAPDTVMPDPIFLVTVTMVFYDQSDTARPNIASSPVAAGNELVPFEYKVVATNNATTIKAVTAPSTYTFPPGPSAQAYSASLPYGLAFDGAVVSSTQYIRGIPGKGTSEYYPNETMWQRPHWVLLEADNAANSKRGFGVVKFVISPAPPNVEPNMDFAPTFSFGQVTPTLGPVPPSLSAPQGQVARNIGLGTYADITLEPNHGEYTQAGYWPRIAQNPHQFNGYLIQAPTEGGGMDPGQGGVYGGGVVGGTINPPYTVGPDFSTGDSRELDGFWDNYVFAPYDANRAIFYPAVNLPPGLREYYEQGDAGLIAGTMQSPGWTMVRASAMNPYGADTKPIVMGCLPVQVTSPLVLRGYVGHPLTEGSGGSGINNQGYQIIGTALPTQFWADGLPPGLSIGSSTGLISGVPLLPSDPNNPYGLPLNSFVRHYTITLYAQNSASNGVGVRTLDLTVTQNPGSPVIWNPPSLFPPPQTYQALPLIAATGVDGRLFSYQITTSVDQTVRPDTYASDPSTPLPVGLSLDPVSGLISGAPMGYGEFSVIIKAHNSVDWGGAVLHISIKAAPPDLSGNTSPTSGIVGLAFTTSGNPYNITATGTAGITYTVAGLPPGLTANGAVIGGIPTQMGPLSSDGSHTLPQSAHITATNAGGSTPFDLDIYIYQRPAVTSAAKASGIVGRVFSYTITTSGSPDLMQYLVQNLPPGLQQQPYPRSNVISGIPTTPVVNWPVQLQLQNICGPKYLVQSTFTLTLTIDALRITNSPLLVTGVQFQPLNPPFQITTNDTPNVYYALGLPAGVSIDQQTGLISGRPFVSGSFAVTIGASNGFIPATANLTMGIAAHPGDPVITSPLIASGEVHSTVPFSYLIRATNNPNSFDAQPPPGATYTLASLGLRLRHSNDANDPGGVDGLIYGTPLVAGTFPIIISASNSVGTGSATLMLAISAVAGAPAITSPLTAKAMVNSQFVYLITGTNSPSSFAATFSGGNLPSGLSVDTGTGIIHGTPNDASITSPTNFNITISATNGAGTGSANLVLTVYPPAPPTITSFGADTGFVGIPYWYGIIADFANSYGAINLPPDLSVDGNSGLISGTPLLAGLYNCTITATNANGVASLPFVLTILPAPGAPVITPANPSVTGTVGLSFSYQIVATLNPTSYNARPFPPASGLPPGLSINGSTGVLSGTPTAAGTYKVILMAYNSVGLGTTVLTVSIVSPLPAITSPGVATGTVGVPFQDPTNLGFQLAASGTPPISWTVSSLPAGLSLVGSTIVGVPSNAGVYTVQVTATNAYGTDTAPLTITILPPQPPTITSTSGFSIQGMVFVPLTYQFTATGSAPIALSASDLPPGLTYANGTISGVPTTPGSYVATLTATNGAGSTTQTLIITIVDLVPGVDSDGDGFPDDVEIFLGSNPLDPNSTPFNGQPGASQPFHMPQPKLAIKLNFAKPGKDTITLSGTLPVPAGFSAPGETLVLDVGGILIKAVLDNRGGSLSADRSATVKLTARNSRAGQNAKYSIRLKGSYQTPLANVGLVNTTVKAAQVNMNVLVLLIESQLMYQKTQTLLYTAKLNRTGTAK